MTDQDLLALEALYDVRIDKTHYGSGHINETFCTKDAPRLLIQRINTAVFADPNGMMQNIIAVTAHLRKKLAEAGKDPDRGTLTPVMTKEGKYLAKIGDSFYRACYFLEDSVYYDMATPALLEEAGAAFGALGCMLEDFPAASLHEVIPHFHDTPHRYADLCRAIEQDTCQRRAELGAEIDFFKSHMAFYSTVTDRLADGRLPLAVTHNDTKINNILFDTEGKALAVIDLDTVMPGSRLYDFGDALRAGAATAEEDEEDLSLVGFDPEKFAAFTRGYLRTAGESLWPEEIALLPESALLMTLECGMRFLTDDLNGDIYFRIHRPRHNLSRARTQIRQAIAIEKQLPQLHQIVEDCLRASH